MGFPYAASNVVSLHTEMVRRLNRQVSPSSARFCEPYTLFFWQLGVPVTSFVQIVPSEP